MSPRVAKKKGNAYAAKCPTRIVLDQISDKWTVLILGALRDGPVRFNSLKRRLEGISQKVLAETLKRLERNGLLTRAAFPTVPVTVEYALTPLGQALSELVNAVRLWAEENITEVLVSQKAFDARKYGDTEFRRSNLHRNVAVTGLLQQKNQAESQSRNKYL